MRYVLMLALVFMMTNCAATEKKCFDVQLLTDGSRFEATFPHAEFRLEGQNRYRSCPGENDPQWMGGQAQGD